MTAYRIKARTKSNRVKNQREYIGLANLLRHGKDVWKRYNSYASAELYEYKLGKWIRIPDSIAIEILSTGTKLDVNLKPINN